MRWLVAVLATLAFAVVSCDTTPVEPPGVEADAATPLFSAEQVWEYGSFDVDVTTYVPCLGEDIRYSGYVPYKTHRVFKPSGGYSDFFALVPATPNTPFYAEGQSSGIIWRAVGSTNPQSTRAGPGEVIHFVGNETYISNDGPTFRNVGEYHVTINANGDVTAFRPFVLSTECKGQG